MTASLCCPPETNTTCKSLYFNEEKFFQKKTDFFDVKTFQFPFLMLLFMLINTVSFYFKTLLAS